MKKFWKIFGIAFGAVALIGGIYAYVVFNAATDLVEAVYNPVDRQEVRGEAVNLGDDPVSILLLGIDREEFQTGGRSDTMMVVTINPNENSAYILSLARDTFVTLAGRGTQERLNHAFAWGGPQMAIETIENFLNIPIDFYAELDMNGFGSLIDAVGGVTVENDFAFTFHNMHFPAGELTLTGEEALGFVRMRYEDPRGDFGRQLRQRSVVETLARGMISSGMTRFQQIFDAAEGYILTDLNMSNITNLLMNYSGAIRNVTQLDLSGTGTIVNGMYVEVIAENDLLAIQNTLREHLELN